MQELLELLAGSIDLLGYELPVLWLVGAGLLLFAAIFRSLWPVILLLILVATFYVMVPSMRV